MNRLMVVEKWCLWGHVFSMMFGLAGLLWVMPHPEILEHLPAGPTLYRWSLAGGGVAYILLAVVAVSLYCFRTFGLKVLLTFFVPAIAVSLISELLGTSTGFPFGDYTYLSGLGYKIAGLVPFTIPLSWFYLGFAAYLLARGSLLQTKTSWWRHGLALSVGALLLMSWDFVLDPAMSQTAMPFWYWHEPGAFFGMPYQNFSGWFFTGLIFMAIAALFWRNSDRLTNITRSSLTLPLVVYLANFGFAMFMSLASGIIPPVLLGLAVGAVPAVICWWLTPTSTEVEAGASEGAQPPSTLIEATATPAAVSK